MLKNSPPKMDNPQNYTSIGRLVYMLFYPECSATKKDRVQMHTCNILCILYVHWICKELFVFDLSFIVWLCSSIERFASYDLIFSLWQMSVSVCICSYTGRENLFDSLFFSVSFISRWLKQNVLVVAIDM